MFVQRDNRINEPNFQFMIKLNINSNHKFVCVTMYAHATRTIRARLIGIRSPFEMIGVIFLSFKEKKGVSWPA